MQIVNPYEGRKGGHYVPGIISRGMLYISGQLPVDPETGIIPEGGIRVQMRRALANVECILKAAGCERSDVVQCRVYIASMDDWDAVNEVYAAFFAAHKPSRVVVPSGRLHYGALVEIEAVAEVNDK